MDDEQGKPTEQRDEQRKPAEPLDEQGKPAEQLDEQVRPAEQMFKSLSARATQQANEEFLAWLKEDDKAKENRGALRELYKFCRWVKDHNAVIIEVSTDEILVGDSTPPEEYRFQPDGGLSVQHWPYLCDLVADVTVEVDIYRDEIMTAILENELHKAGRSGAAAFRAVETSKVEKAGFASGPPSKPRDSRR